MSNWSGLEDWQKADIACELLNDWVKHAEEYLDAFGEYPEYLTSKSIKHFKKVSENLRTHYGLMCGGGRTKNGNWE